MTCYDLMKPGTFSGGDDGGGFWTPEKRSPTVGRGIKGKTMPGSRSERHSQGERCLNSIHWTSCGGWSFGL